MVLNLWDATPFGDCISDILHVRYLHYDLQQWKNHSYQAANSVMVEGHHIMRNYIKRSQH